MKGDEFLIFKTDYGGFYQTWGSEEVCYFSLWKFVFVFF